jgi:hypothetical protein
MRTKNPVYSAFETVTGVVGLSIQVPRLTRKAPACGNRSTARHAD